MEHQYLREALLSYARSTKNGILHDLFSHEANRKNPLCGDEVEVRLTVTDGTVVDCSFKARGCAICTAATALMSEIVVNMTVQEVHALAQNFEWYISGENDHSTVDREIPDDIVIFEPLRQNPRRRECALLPWRALREALE